METADAAVATAAEVSETIEKLSPADLIRLQGYARRKIDALGGLVRGHNEEDLLEEAMLRVLDGREPPRLRGKHHRSWRSRHYHGP
jgi:hypothetical protein